MRLVFFAGRMPDLGGPFLPDIHIATDIQRRVHDFFFMTVLGDDDVTTAECVVFVAG
jgi:hypothetical protein